MANQQGFSAKDGIGALSKILRHYDRSKMYDKEGNLRYSYYPNLTQRGYEKSYTTSQIDAARTHLNYNLAPAREGGQRAFIERRLGEVYAHKSALANALVDWVVTLPDMEQYEGREREFFECAYEFCAEKYGEENVVSAYVHMDEVQPHMHFAFLPIVPDAKHEQGWKLSKKEANTCERIGKNGLPMRDTAEFSRQFHESLNVHVEAAMGLEHGGIVLTDEQREKRRIKENMGSPAELRRASAELDRIERDAEAANQRLERLRREEEGAAEEVAELEKAAMEPASEGIAESVRTLIAGRGDGEREEVLAGEIESLRERIGELERARDAARERVGLLGSRIEAIRANCGLVRGRIDEAGERSLAAANRAIGVRERIKGLWSRLMRHPGFRERVEREQEKQRQRRHGRGRAR